ncbi:hypothetical protein GCM10010302_18360 [Streptomyces polychromogenes]|uniref:Integral membrane protein n=1 Tax=Streptomyces polychromogenes TaxID=67342 RepID=A0ABP3EVP4_9ACTN
MTNAPAVVVGRPDGFGLRKVTVDGKPVGQARSAGDLQKILRRAGVAFEKDIQWIGGDCTVWPGYPWKRRAVGLAMTAGLLATACELVWIGRIDAFHALSYPGRVTGIIFLGAAVVAVAAALAAFDYWHKRKRSYSGIIIFIGGLSALAVNLLLLFMHVNAWEYTPYLLVRAALAFWSVWALWVLCRNRAWTGIRNPVRVLAGAVIPILLAVANMAYTQIYLPSVTYPLVETGADLGTAAWDGKGKVMVLTVHLHVKNLGQIPVYILGSIYFINGRTPSNVQPGQPQAQYRLVTSGEFINPPGLSLSPGEEMSADEYVEIPQPDRFKSIMAQTELYMVRKDKATVSAEYELSGIGRGKLQKQGRAEDPPGPAADYFRYQADLSNSNELLNETRGRPRVTLWWVRQNRYPYITVAVTAPGEKKPFSVNYLFRNDKAIERYGLQKVRGSMTQKTYAQLLLEAEGKRPAGDARARPTDSGRPS